TSIWFVRRTRAILRSAEFGFLGVIVRTWRHTPRFCGAPGMGTWRWRRLFQFLRIAGALILPILARRPWRTSWLIVGTKTLPRLSDGQWRRDGGHRSPCCRGRRTPRHEGGVYQSADEGVKRGATLAGRPGEGRIPLSARPGWGRQRGAAISP